MTTSSVPGSTDIEDRLERIEKRLGLDDPALLQWIKQHLTQIFLGGLLVILLGFIGWLQIDIDRTEEAWRVFYQEEVDARAEFEQEVTEQLAAQEQVVTVMLAAQEQANTEQFAEQDKDISIKLEQLLQSVDNIEGDILLINQRLANIENALLE